MLPIFFSTHKILHCKICFPNGRKQIINSPSTYFVYIYIFLIDKNRHIAELNKEKYDMSGLSAILKNSLYILFQLLRQFF